MATALQQIARLDLLADRVARTPAFGALATLQRELLPDHEGAVADLVDAVVDDDGYVDGKVIRFIDRRIGQLESEVDEQLSEILHDPAFQRLEAGQAAVERLVFDRDNRGVQFRLLNEGGAGLRDDLAEADGIVDKTRFYRVACRDEFHAPGGRPYQLVVFAEDSFGCRDVELLDAVATVAAEAHFGVLAGADPGLVVPHEADEDEPRGFFSLPSDPSLIGGELEKPDAAGFRALQRETRAMQVGLCVGRPLLRRPYHPVRNPARGLEWFEERIAGDDDLSFGSPALPVASRLTGALSKHGTTSQILGVDSGGREHVPVHVIGDRQLKFDVRIDEISEPALSRLGLIAFVDWKDEPFAVLFGASSLYRPGEPDDPQEAADAQLAGRLTYTLLRNQFGHWLKAELRRHLGQDLTADQVRDRIERTIAARWVSDRDALPAERARKPFARIVTRVTALGPGQFRAEVELYPSLLVDGVHIMLRTRAEATSVKP